MSSVRSKFQGIKDPRWTIKDKQNQYRGILKLHSREKKARWIEATKLRKIVARDLKSLVGDAHRYRRVVVEIATGDKNRISNALKNDRSLQLAYQRLLPENVCDFVYQDCQLKRRQLDKLYNEKRLKAKNYLRIQWERDVLLAMHEAEQDGWEKRVQQLLISRFQRSIAKQNAAKAIRSAYEDILDILHKDTSYYDYVLNQLKRDQRDQCKVILAVTIMGQLAAENLDDVRNKYLTMTRDVWQNMRERERNLVSVRERVDDLWAYAQSVVRVESDTAFRARTTSTISRDDALEKQVQLLEKVFCKVNAALKVRSHLELIPRFEEQARQKERLLLQYNYNVAERDSLLIRKNQAVVTLATLDHTTIEGTAQFKADSAVLLEQLQIQKVRESTNKTLRKSRGVLLMNIRAALQNMLCMLIFIKRTGKAFKKFSKDEKRKSQKQYSDDEEKVLEKVTDEKDLWGYQIESDGLTLLSHVSRKIGTLFGMSSYDLDEERESRARDLYETYIADYNTKKRFIDEAHEPAGLVVEHEIVDLTVPTRNDIKLRSKQIVEMNLKPEI